MENPGAVIWHETLPLEQLPEGGGVSRVVGDERIALFRIADRVYALRDQCPHQGALLSKGDTFVEGDEPPVVICPVHCWAFSLADGRCPDDPDYQARSFPTKVEDGRVLVGLPAGATPSP